MLGKPSVTFHLITLVIVGMLAYVVFSNPAIEPEKGIQVLNIKKSELSHVSWVNESKRIDVSPRKNGGFTLTVSEYPTQAAQSGAAVADFENGRIPDEVTQNDTPQNRRPDTHQPKITSYRAGTIFEDKLDKLFPMLVERDLGKVSQQQLIEYGLDDPKSTLEISAKDQKVRFAVGGKTYGGATTYIQQLPNGPVYLLASDFIRSLDINAGGFMERRLLGVEQDAVDTISLEKDKRQQSLIQRGQGRFGQWVPEKNPGTKNTIFDNWVKSIFKTPIEEYIFEESLVPNLQEEVKIVLKRGGDVLDVLKLASFQRDDGEGKPVFYAKNDFVGQWVTIRSSDAERILSELPSIMEND